MKVEIKNPKLNRLCDKLTTIFRNDKLFRISSVLAAVFWLIAIAHAAGNIRNLAYILQMILMVTCIVFNYFAYRNRENSLCKSLIGALLGVHICDLLYFLSEHYFEYGLDMETWVLIAQLISAVMLFANHFKMMAEHNSNKNTVFFSQALIIVKSLITIADYALCLTLPFGEYGINIGLLFDGLGCIASYILVVCVEARLDSYRLIRESAEAEGIWTEEMKEETKLKVFGKK